MKKITRGQNSFFFPPNKKNKSGFQVDILGFCWDVVKRFFCGGSEEKEIQTPLSNWGCLKHFSKKKQAAGDNNGGENK